MKIVQYVHDGQKMKKIKDIEIDSKEYTINVPGVGKIIVKKKMPTVLVDDELYVEKQYSATINGHSLTGSRYAILERLLKSKITDISPEDIDTLYYDVPSKIGVVLTVYRENKKIAVISYELKGGALNISIMHYGEGGIPRGVVQYVFL